MLVETTLKLGTICHQLVWIDCLMIYEWQKAIQSVFQGSS